MNKRIHKALRRTGGESPLSSHLLDKERQAAEMLARAMLNIDHENYISHSMDLRERRSIDEYRPMLLPIRQMGWGKEHVPFMEQPIMDALIRGHYREGRLAWVNRFTMRNEILFFVLAKASEEVGCGLGRALFTNDSVSNVESDNTMDPVVIEIGWAWQTPYWTCIMAMLRRRTHLFTLDFLEMADYLEMSYLDEKEEHQPDPLEYWQEKDLMRLLRSKFKHSHFPRSCPRGVDGHWFDHARTWLKNSTRTRVDISNIDMWETSIWYTSTDFHRVIISDNDRFNASEMMRSIDDEIQSLWNDGRFFAGMDRMTYRVDDSRVFRERSTDATIEQMAEQEEMRMEFVQLIEMAKRAWEKKAD